MKNPFNKSANKGTQETNTAASTADTWRRVKLDLAEAREDVDRLNATVDDLTRNMAPLAELVEAGRARDLAQTRLGVALARHKETGLAYLQAERDRLRALTQNAWARQEAASELALKTGREVMELNPQTRMGQMTAAANTEEIDQRFITPWLIASRAKVMADIERVRAGNEVQQAISDCEAVTAELKGLGWVEPPVKQQADFEREQYEAKLAAAPQIAARERQLTRAEHEQVEAERKQAEREKQQQDAKDWAEILRIRSDASTLR